MVFLIPGFVIPDQVRNAFYLHALYHNYSVTSHLSDLS